ncbi:NAD(P)H-dependent oxidoreductase [Mesorhizobium sp. M00.F.Ca.ET.216.01.1.1]|uniref:FMN-dependent NADH-azoreductase n=1 Tax=Mesorhizobium sp. M00.F.Ca.ET.216.01.1.1 TaxID=2500528 RepID=UPI000FD94CBB|nr:NAD(P)H-dependent oxidoreductase [Mesorhizobium sp. M00.F.Ca.ET.216.01.1.1]TGQ30420.1 flavodoxin family protein [Mesorhizobium sp. M00.F.Ca.ET.216.01.1.1]
MNILHIDASPRQESHSRQLSAAIVERLLEVAPGARVSRRDLGADPLPHAAADYAVALSSPATLAAPPKGALDCSEALIQEVEAADVIVIGTPMHNFTIPSVLKAWIDQILRVGRTMKSTPAGKVGMLRDRPVFIGVASGGIFTGDRPNQPDFLTPYLTLALNSIGLKNLQFLPIQATASFDHNQAALAREKALAAIDLTDMGSFAASMVAPQCSQVPVEGPCFGESRTGSALRARRKLLARPHHNPPASAGL